MHQDEGNGMKQELPNYTDKKVSQPQILSGAKRAMP